MLENISYSICLFFFDYNMFRWFVYINVYFLFLVGGWKLCGWNEILFYMSYRLIMFYIYIYTIMMVYIWIAPIILILDRYSIIIQQQNNNRHYTCGGGWINSIKMFTVHQPQTKWIACVSQSAFISY